LKESKEIIYPIAACIGYIEGIEGGEDHGIVADEVLLEDEHFKELLSKISDHSNDDLKRAFEEYQKARKSKNKRLLSFCMDRVTRLKEMIAGSEDV